MADRAGNDQIFVIHLWIEPRPGGDGPRRGYVEHIASHERRYFSQLEEAVAFVGAFARGGPADDENSSATGLRECGVAPGQQRCRLGRSDRAGTKHFGGAPMSATAACTHLDSMRDVTPQTTGCRECLEIGDTWVHLRLCTHCGHVGCCDSSKNKHATKHYHATKHPIIASLEPGEHWKWCFIDGLSWG